MAGVNPYMKPGEIEFPKKPYKIKFLPMGVTVEVDPGRYREPGIGQAGCILDIALENGVEMDHSCGGVCACSTCHVHVLEGLESCNEAGEDEEDMLDMAPALTPRSRLACQAVPNGTRDVVVEVPGWNRNQVKENH